MAKKKEVKKKETLPRGMFRISENVVVRADDVMAIKISRRSYCPGGYNNCAKQNWYSVRMFVQGSTDPIYDKEFNFGNCLGPGTNMVDEKRRDRMFTAAKKYEKELLSMIVAAQNQLIA